MNDAPSAARRPVQKALVKRRVVVRDQHVRQPHVAEHRCDEVASFRLGGGGFEGRNQPHAPNQEVDVHLQKVVAGAGDGQLEEVQADTPAASRGYRQGEQQACLSQVVDLYALTRRACAHVLLHRRLQAWPPHRSARHGKRPVATEVPAQ